MTNCPVCAGSGYTAAGALLDYLMRDLLNLGREGQGQDARRSTMPPTALIRRRMLTPPPGPVGRDGLDLTVGLVGSPPLGPIGYGAESSYAAARKVVAAAGLDPDTWGVCPACGGSGESGGEVRDGGE